MIDPKIENEILSSPAQLLFISANDPLSLCIRVASGFSRASHAALAVGSRGQWILHAIEEGVRLEPLDDYLTSSRSTIHARFLVLPDVRSGIARGLALIGQPYDFREIVLRVLSLVSPIAAQRRLWPIRYDAWTCARYGLHLLRDHVPEWQTLPAWVMPQDLLDRVGPSFQPMV